MFLTFLCGHWININRYCTKTYVLMKILQNIFLININRYCTKTNDSFMNGIYEVMININRYCTKTMINYLFLLFIFDKYQQILYENPICLSSIISFLLININRYCTKTRLYKFYPPRST